MLTEVFDFMFVWVSRFGSYFWTKNPLVVNGNKLTSPLSSIFALFPGTFIIVYGGVGTIMCYAGRELNELVSESKELGLKSIF